MKTNENSLSNESNFETKRDFFGLHQKNTTIKKEIIAGIITFMSMFYIIAVQMSFFSNVEGISPGTFGIVTALAAGLTSILMGLYANHPAALAPGMGVNAFVAFTLLGPSMGIGSALSAVLISGLLFIIISITPVREKIMSSIPDDLRKAIAIGVGLFLMFVALTNGELIMNASDDPFLGTPTSIGPLNDPFVLLTLFGIILTIILWILDIPGGVLLSMVATVIIGLILGLTNWEVGVGDGTLNLPKLEFNIEDYTQSFEDLPNLLGVAFVGLGNTKETWANPSWYMAIFTLFLMDFFDTAGTLFGLNASMGDIEVSNETNKKVLIVDAVGTFSGAILGSTNITTFAESATGIQAGGRSGLTSITTGTLFLLFIPLIPLLVPLLTYSVTAGPIVLIGIIMATNFKDFNTDDKVILSSSIIIIIFMILGYSIGLGIVIGLLFYIILMIVTGRIKELDLALIISSPLFLAFLILPIFV